MGYQPRRADTRSGAILGGRSVLEVSQARRVGPSKPFDMRHQVPGFDVYPAGFQSCFGSLFLLSAPIPCWKALKCRFLGPVRI